MIVNIIRPGTDGLRSSPFAAIVEAEHSDGSVSIRFENSTMSHRIARALLLEEKSSGELVWATEFVSRV